MSFDIVAPHYRWMEFVLAGEKLQRCRMAFLDEVRGALNVLILGEGNGRFLAECRRKLPDARITCVDASGRMLDLARARVERAGLSGRKIKFVRADALTWTPVSNEFDLIVTHFFLDCFRPEQLEGIIGRISRTATKHAAWLLADFHVPDAGVRRYRAEIIHWMMYSFFRVVARLPARCLTSPVVFLEAHGFRLRGKRESEWGLLHTDYWKR